MPNPLIIGLGPDQILNPTNAETTYKGAMPVAQVTMLTALQAELLAARRETTTATTTTVIKKATAPTVANLPKNVTGSVTAEAYKTKTSQVIEVVGVSFTKAPGDIWLSGVNVWFSGYHGNANPVLMASGTESPFSFAADVTGETVTVTLQSLGQNGLELPLATSPTYSLALTGVAGAPPAPSIASYLTSVVNGYQFSFNQEAGLLADVVAGYNIYHATTTTFPGASGLIHTVPQNTILNGVYVFTDPWPTDVSPTAVSHYYWVTAFNTSGDESAATEAWQQAIAPPNAMPTVNLVPDSNFLLPSAYWNGANDSHLPVVVNTGYMGATSIEGGVTGVVSYRRSNAFTLLANTRYWVCARQNTLGATGNPAGWGLVDASTGTFYVDLRQNDLSHGSLVFASYTPSANVSVQMSFGTNGCTLGANGYNSIGGSEPMVCVALPGTTMPPPYVASVLDTNTGGLASGISLQSLSSGSLGLQIGDVHDRVNGSIGAAAENYLIAGGKVAWRALLGDTSGDTATDLVDAANKRFLHGAMSTPTQNVVNTSSQITSGTGIAGVTESALTMQVLHDRVSATIGGYTATGLDNVDDGSTYLRPQGVSSGHQLTYHGLYGDTSGDTTTAIVDAANKRFVHGAMSTATQAVVQPNGVAISSAYQTAAATNPSHLWAFGSGAANQSDAGSDPLTLTYNSTQPSGAAAGVSGGKLVAGDQRTGSYSISGANWYTANDAGFAASWSVSVWLSAGSYSWGAGSAILGTQNSVYGGSTPSLAAPILDIDANGYVYAGAYLGEAVVVKSPKPIDPSVPHHIAVTVDGSFRLWLYIDGQWANGATGTAGSQTGAQSWSVGMNYTDGNWPGMPLNSTSSWNLTSGAGINLQDLAIWNGVTLSPVQVGAIYAGGSLAQYNLYQHSLGNVRDGPDANGVAWNRLANVASDNSGVTLGYSGKVQMVVGSGFFSPSTGGYIPKRTLFTAPTGTEANGTVIDFANLTDQAGNPLPTFDVPPLVALQPYNMTSPPSVLYASGMTTTGFTLNSYNSGTTSNISAVNLPNGTTETVTATSGDTITGVTYTASVTAKVITPMQNFSQSVGCYLNGTAIGTITINGQTGGGTYHGSLSAAVSGNPTSVTAKATWTTGSDVSSVSAIATGQQISGETPVSANVTCSITEPWSA